MANDDITDFAEENNGFEHGIIAEASPSSMRGSITAVYTEHGDKAIGKLGSSYLVTDDDRAIARYPD